ncbi:MAG: hypothetical protein R3F11_25475 [Verrucomicrobiales bacterium]
MTLEIVQTNNDIIGNQIINGDGSRSSAARKSTRSSWCRTARSS